MLYKAIRDDAPKLERATARFNLAKSISPNVAEEHESYARGGCNGRATRHNLQKLHETGATLYRQAAAEFQGDCRHQIAIREDLTNEANRDEKFQTKLAEMFSGPAKGSSDKKDCSYFDAHEF